MAGADAPDVAALAWAECDTGPAGLRAVRWWDGDWSLMLLVRSGVARALPRERRRREGTKNCIFAARIEKGSWELCWVCVSE